jgi:hypothetical protein
MIFLRAMLLKKLITFYNAKCAIEIDVLHNAIIVLLKSTLGPKKKKSKY